MAEALVDVERVAKALRCSERQVQLLVRDGMPKRAHGQYSLLDCYDWYIDRLLKKAEQDSGDGLEYEQERLTKAKADMAELELQEKIGTLVMADSVKTALLAEYSTLRQHILALAARVSPQLEGLDRSAIKAKLHAGLRGLLAALAGGLGLPEVTAATDGGAADPDAQPAGSGHPAADRGAKPRHHAKRVRKRTRRAGPAARTKHQPVGGTKPDPAQGK